jgi:tetratricopeptide (TPR) repeat protein
LLHRQEADLFVAKTALMQNPVNQNLASLNAQKVLDNKLSDPYYRYEAALILNQLGKTDLAESLVDQILSENPRNLVMLNWVVQKEVRKGNYNDALIRTKQIEMYDPWNVKNLLSMGELYKFLGQNSAMEDIRLKINKIAPNTEVSQVANQILK